MKDSRRDTDGLIQTHKEQGHLLMRGFLTVYALRLLWERPRYGNEIIAEIETISQGAWAPSAGAIYPLLRRLEDNGFVAGAWEHSDKRPRRFYKITPAGRTELARLLETMRPQIDHAIRTLQHHRAFLFGPLAEDTD